MVLRDELQRQRGWLAQDDAALSIEQKFGEPFVYVKLGATGLQKVALDDAAAFASSAWDLAFKRYVIRTNGGDSGPGGASVASVDAAALADVTSAPPAASFLADDWTSDACAPIVDTLGAPVTAFGTWYSANTMVIEPLPKVYVVRRADGTTFKLRVQTYYGDPADATRSAVLRVEWAPV